MSQNSYGKLLASSTRKPNSSSLNFELIFSSSKCVKDQSYFLCLHNDSSRSQRALHLHNANWTLSTHRTTEPTDAPSNIKMTSIQRNELGLVCKRYAFVQWCMYAYTKPSQIHFVIDDHCVFEVHMRTRRYSFGRSETRSVHCVSSQAERHSQLLQYRWTMKLNANI